MGWQTYSIPELNWLSSERSRGSQWRPNFNGAFHPLNRDLPRSGWPKCLGTQGWGHTLSWPTLGFLTLTFERAWKPFQNWAPYFGSIHLSALLNTGKQEFLPLGRATLTLKVHRQPHSGDPQPGEANFRHKGSQTESPVNAADQGAHLSARKMCSNPPFKNFLPPPWRFSYPSPGSFFPSGFQTHVDPTLLSNTSISLRGRHQRGFQQQNLRGERGQTSAAREKDPALYHWGQNTVRLARTPTIIFFQTTPFGEHTLRGQHAPLFLGDSGRPPLFSQQKNTRASLSPCIRRLTPQMCPLASVSRTQNTRGSTPGVDGRTSASSRGATTPAEKPGPLKKPPANHHPPFPERP